MTDKKYTGSKFTRGFLVLVRRLHFLVPIAMIVPCFCLIVTFGMSEKEASDACALLLPLYLITLSLALPACLFYFLQDKVKNLGLFLLCAFPAGFLFLWALAMGQFALGLSILGGEQVPQALILLLFLLDAIRMRTNDNSRRKAKAQEDHSWGGDLYLLPLPSLKLLIPFPVIYISALCLHNQELAGVALVGAILYFFLILPYHVLIGKEKYLDSRHHISRIPESRIGKLQGRTLAIILVPCALLAAAALMTSGSRRFMDLPKFPLELLLDRDLKPPQGAMYDRNGILRMLIELGLLRAGAAPPAWLVSLIDFTENVLALFMTVVMIWFFWVCARSLYRRFRLQPKEKIPEAIPGKETDEHISLKKQFRMPGSGSKSGGIRRRYRRIILKYRGGPPEIYETPSMMEERSGVPDTEQMHDLHDEYIRVRYGR